MLRIKINSGKVYNNIQKYVVYNIPDFVLEIIDMFPGVFSADFEDYMKTTYKIPGLQLESANDCLIVTAKLGIKLPATNVYNDTEPSISDLIAKYTKEWVDLTFDKVDAEVKCSDIVCKLQSNAQKGSMQDKANYEKLLGIFAGVFDWPVRQLKEWVENISEDSQQSLNTHFFKQFTNEELWLALAYSFYIHRRPLIL